MTTQNMRFDLVFLLICIAGFALVGVMATLIYVYGSEPFVPYEVEYACGVCYKENYNAEFFDPVMAFYWLEVNQQTDPHLIIMKYDIAEKCGHSCTIPDRSEEKKMIRRVIEIHNAGGHT